MKWLLGRSTCIGMMLLMASFLSHAETRSIMPSFLGLGNNNNANTTGGHEANALTGAPEDVATPAPVAPAVPTGIAPQQSAGFQPVGGAPTSGAGSTPALKYLVDPAVIGTTADPAFQNMTGKIFPMSPDQIQALRNVQDSTQRAIATTPGSPPRPVVSTQNVLLSPGAVPPIVRLGTGYVTSIVFIDQTGQPWPIASYSIGDPTRFNIQWDQESNVMMMQGHGAYATGNMAITLRDLPTPVMLTLVSDQRVVDYRLDLRVQGRGPKAAGSIIAGTMPTNSNPILMNLLDGVAPTDAKLLEVDGGHAQAWLYNNTMLLRTPLTVLSPSWHATMSSPDGTKVYQLTPTPLVLVSDQGRSTTIQIKGL
ncbi:MAG: DotH/IcmK family type IV secretion protein [Gammaproteobacteria bacterium]